MYVLEVEEKERDYLLALLKSQHEPLARTLAGRLRKSAEVFGIAMWTDADIASQLKKGALPASPENIEAVRDSYYCRHIADRMIETGWEMLEEAVSELVP